MDNTTNNVNITAQQAAQSQKLKREKVARTIHQQQVYRAAQNLYSFYQYFYIDGHYERVKIKSKAKPQYLAA